MGYTTTFSGVFYFNKPLTPQIIEKLRTLEGMDGRDFEDDRPQGYCQWNLTRDLKGLTWDGAEKFYDYIEWLEWIIKRILKPAKIEINGAVEYQGEFVGDCGAIIVKANQVRLARVSVLEALELKAFKEFVLDSEYGEAIWEWWRLHKKTLQEKVNQS